MRYTPKVGDVVTPVHEYNKDAQWLVIASSVYGIRFDWLGDHPNTPSERFGDSYGLEVEFVRDATFAELRLARIQ